MSAQELVNACKNNLFPSIATVTRFGLDGNKPVEIFTCYRCAVLEDGVTARDIESNYSDISNFILKRSESVKYLDCYDSVIESGGIKVSTEQPQKECSSCRMCMDHQDGLCVNCGTQLKV